MSAYSNSKYFVSYLADGNAKQVMLEGLAYIFIKMLAGPITSSHRNIPP